MSSIVPSRQATAQAACPVGEYSWSYDANNKNFPEDVNGVLFLDNQAGDPFVCSASLINKQILLTAAHCVSDGAGNWNKDFVWAPGYLDQSIPFGEFSGTYAFALTRYHNGHDEAFDVGMVVIDKPVGNQLGWLGLMTGSDISGREWSQYGYPQESPFDGQKLVVNVSGNAVRDCSFNPCTAGVSSIMTGGSSGGPWVYANNGSLYANGLNAYRNLRCSNNMFTPYFGPSVWNMYQEALNQQPPSPVAVTRPLVNLRPEAWDKLSAIPW